MKVIVDGETDATPVAGTPVPVIVIVCGLLVALSLIVSVAVREPVAVGVKAMLIVQVGAGDVGGAVCTKLLPLVQVVPLAIAKSPAFVPLIAGDSVNVRFPLPVLLTVTEEAALVVLTA